MSEFEVGQDVVHYDPHSAEFRPCRVVEVTHGMTVDTIREASKLLGIELD